MNKTIIFRKIGGIISEITEQYQYLSDDPENINPLELELFVANSHFLSEHLAILKKLDLSAEPESSRSKSNTPEELKPVLTGTFDSSTEIENHLESNVEEPSIFNQADEIRGVPVGTKDDMWLEPVSESEARFSNVSLTEDIPQRHLKSDTPPNVSEFSEEAATKLPEPSNVEIKPVVQPEILKEVKFEKPEPELLKGIEAANESDPIKQLKQLEQTEITRDAESVKESFPAKGKIPREEPVNDKSSTAERVPTLNEILSASKNRETATSNINVPEDRDLKSMIKLNDKLMFVRDLFNGYSLAYSEAVDLVNRFDNFKSADNFLKQNYAEKNRWSEKQNSVDQFYEILNKRFS